MKNDNNTNKKSLNIKVNLVYLIVTILSILVIVNNIAFARVPGKVNTSNIRIRKEPNTTSTVITNLYKTDYIHVLAISGEWYKIETEEKQIGYIKAEFVDTNKEKVSKLPNESASSTNTATTTETTTSNNGAATNTPEVKVEEKVVEKPAEEKNTTLLENKETVKMKTATKLKGIPSHLSLDKIDVKVGEELKKLEQRNNWVKVLKDNKEYWVNINFVE